LLGGGFAAEEGLSGGVETVEFAFDPGSFLPAVVCDQACRAVGGDDDGDTREQDQTVGGEAVGSVGPAAATLDGTLER
jgi:hypothetical protein